MTYKTKDSGKRVKFKSGFNRDVQEGKPRYDLIPHELLTRLAELYARGAEKYGEYNWQKAESQEEFNRFKASGWRHWIQWMRGDEDEDHAMAVCWNIIAYEWLTKYKPSPKEKVIDTKAIDEAIESLFPPKTFGECKIGAVFNNKVSRWYKNSETTALVLVSNIHSIGGEFEFDNNDEIIFLYQP